MVMNKIQKHQYLHIVIDYMQNLSTGVLKSIVPFIMKLNNQNNRLLYPNVSGKEVSHAVIFFIKLY